MPDAGPHDAPEHSDLLDELAQEFVARLRQGQKPSVEDYAQRYPQLATVRREMLPSVIALE